MSMSNEPSRPSPDVSMPSGTVPGAAQPPVATPAPPPGTPSGGISSEAPSAGTTKDAAAGAARDVLDDVAGGVSDVKSEAGAQLGNVKDEALVKANDLLGQARQQVATQAEQGTHQLAQTLKEAGQELTAMAERSEQGDGPMTALVRQVGTQATEVGDRFAAGGYKALAGDLSGYARSSPGLFLLFAAGAGFAVGRVLRNADTKAITSAARQNDAEASSGPESPTSSELPSDAASRPERGGSYGIESQDVPSVVGDV